MRRDEMNVKTQLTKNKGKTIVVVIIGGWQ
jgi:hypothetical protein